MRYLFFIFPLLFLSFQGQDKNALQRVPEAMAVLDNSGNLLSNSFSRDTIMNTLKKKVERKIPLIVHVFVPLCDNKNQGIVPVSASLGDGMNLTTNLYWGAAYGVKTYFKKNTDWKFLKSISKPDSSILERIVLTKKFPNGATVYFIADAYRGDRMKACLETYFKSIAGIKHESVALEGVTLLVAGEADLVIFNGHNGLMDSEVTIPKDKDSGKKDACAIACVSRGYFNDLYAISGAYPLITTTNFMAPEAYVLEAIVNTWSSMKSPEEIRNAA